MDFFLQFATGIVAHRSNESGWSFLGSAACFRQRATALTAAHCVPEGAEEALFLVLNGKPYPATEVVRHEKSDVAALTARVGEEDEFLQHHVFDGVSSGLIEGGDFNAYGYLSEGPMTGPKLVGRYLKGNFQRYFGYISPQGHDYFAGELSVPAPSGLSGGPVVYPHDSKNLAGIVTSNVESYAILDQVEEAREDGRTTKYESRRVLSYGLCAMLSGLNEWLDDQVPS